jgi:hypothetical protein
LNAYLVSSLTTPLSASSVVPAGPTFDLIISTS